MARRPAKQGATPRAKSGSGTQATAAHVELRDGGRLRFAHAREADAAELLEYCEAIAAESDFLTFGPGEFGVPLSEEQAFIRSLEGGSRGLMIKALVDDRLAGLGTLSRSTRPRLRHEGVLGISVLERHWGRGVGRALIEAVLEEGRASGVTRVALTVRADNARAIGLYERLGFVHEGRAVGSMMIAGKPHDVLLMARFI
jgi:RimJ/RimL family protein N-acetyltransferase